nr:OB-fold domain-containing protein [Rhodococcus sp. KBW08]
MRCSLPHFYPRAVCPFCASRELRWVPASGLGTVYSTTVVRSRAAMRNIALIDLDEGPRMMSRVEEIEPEHVAIGMRVTAFIIDDGGTPLVIFTPGIGGSR